MCILCAGDMHAYPDHTVASRHRDRNGKATHTAAAESTWDPAPAPAPPDSRAQPQTDRPLSDIREITETSLLDTYVKGGTSGQPAQALHRRSSLKRNGSMKGGQSVRIVEPQAHDQLGYTRLEAWSSSSPEYSNNLASPFGMPSRSVPRRSSPFAIPPRSVPPRSSSRGRQDARRSRSISARAEQP